MLGCCHGDEEYFVKQLARGTGDESCSRLGGERQLLSVKTARRMVGLGDSLVPAVNQRPQVWVWLWTPISFLPAEGPVDPFALPRVLRNCKLSSDKNKIFSREALTQANSAEGPGAPSLASLREARRSAVSVSSSTDLSAWEDTSARSL